MMTYNTEQNVMENFVMDLFKNKLLKVKTTHYFIIDPSLISSHSMTSYQLNWAILLASVQTVIIGHNLLPFGVCKYLVSTQIMTVSTTQIFTRFSTHCVETIVCFSITNLYMYKYVSRILRR